MGLWDAVTRFVVGEPPRPVTRLSREEVIDIARAAIRDRPRSQDLGLAEARREDGRLVWHVSTATVGSGYCVMIDDATGTVISEGGWGVR